MPFTVQLTVVSVALVTVAVNVTWLPSTTEPLEGVTVTVIEGGGGGGGGGAIAPPPPQPIVPAPAAKRAKKLARVLPRLSATICGRGRITCTMQAKCQRKNQGLGVSD